MLAMACFADSLRVERKILGPNHREVAILWFEAATVYLEQGEGDRGELNKGLDYFTQVLDITKPVKMQRTTCWCLLAQSHRKMDYAQKSRLFGQSLQPV